MRGPGPLAYLGMLLVLLGSLNDDLIVATWLIAIGIALIAGDIVLALADRGGDK